MNHQEHLQDEEKQQGKKDIDGLFADPMPVVTEALRKYDTREEVLNNLPDFAG